MLPGGVAGMRPAVQHQQQGQQQRNTMQTNTLGRVVLSGPQLVNTRPQNPGITLGTIAPGQTPALILKTDTGFQLLRVGTAATSGGQTVGTSAANATTQIRLATVPAGVSRFTGPSPTIAPLRRTTFVGSTNVSTNITTSTNTVSALQPQQKQQHMQPVFISHQQQQVIPQQSSQILQQQQQHQLQQHQQTFTIRQLRPIHSMSSTSVANVVTGTNPIQHQQVTSSIQSHGQSQHLPTTSLHMHTQSLGQIQTITTSQHQQQQPPQLLPPNMNSSTTSTSSSGNTTVVNTQSITQIQQQQQQQQNTGQGNTKEKCRKFLANLIDLSTREPKPVEKNVRNLIQELVDAHVEPEEFCDRLEKLLNASPQPCLIGFLKKSLPLLRQALFTKELVIEGIKPPQHHIIAPNHLPHQLPRIQAQIRPINQTTTTIGQTQVRMISTAQAGLSLTGTSSLISNNTLRPIGQTTISRQTVNSAGIRIQTPTGVPRLINTQIRGPLQPSIQHQQQGTQPPQLHTNIGQSQNIVQIRAPSLATQRPATVQIRAANNRRATNIVTGSSITAVRVGQTQIKAVPSSIANMVSLSQPPSLTAISSGSHSSGAMLSSSLLSNINSASSVGSMGSGLVPTSLPTPSLPTVQLPPGVGSTTLDAAKAAAAAADSRGEALAAAAAAAKAAAASEKPLPVLTMSSATANSSILASSIPSMQNKTIKTISNVNANKATIKKKKEPLDKEKDDKTNTLASTGIGGSSSFFPQPSISSASTTIFGDDDINDVAAMGGVNLAEESQRILGCTENIGTQIRSCKDEAFLNLSGLLSRFRLKCSELGLDEPNQDTAVLLSHGAQEYIKTIIEKLCVTAEHRQDILKMDPRYEVLHDVRGQVKFLEELDKAEQKRHEEIEREMLLRAAKSRSKIEDPEQAKMKARAKEMQRAEMEELRQRDANMTALQAIGPRKKPKLEGDSSSGIGSGASGGMSSSLTNPPPLRPRIKRVNMRDMIFFMEQEKEFMHSELLFKAYLK